MHGDKFGIATEELGKAVTWANLEMKPQGEISEHNTFEMIGTLLHSQNYKCAIIFYYEPVMLNILRNYI